MLNRVAGSVGDYNLSLGEIYRAFTSTGIRIPNGFPVTGWAEGRYEVDGRPNTLADIRVSIFCVGTVWDHVAPWHSVYKIHLFADTCVTFVLTTGSHNAGIVSEPGHQHRSFQIETKKRRRTICGRGYLAGNRAENGWIMVARMAIVAS